MTTRIGDIIQPEIFTDYVVQRTMEVSNILNSGIATNDSEFNQLASGPNTLVNMPYFNDLTGDSEIMKDDGALTPGKIGTSKDVARKQGRARAWGANGLSALLSGADPMRAIGDLVTNYWARDRQKILLATLKGVFASESMADKVHDVTAGTGAAALINGNTFIDATQKMGDAKDVLTAVTMHSAVEAYLAKQQLIEYVQEANQSVRVPYFMGKRVIVDDAMPFDTANGIGTAYLFGAGAFAWGNGSHPNILGTEVDRDSLASSGEDFLINRNIFILHPRGVKFTEASVTDVFPTNTELANGANWELVYEPKAVRMVNFKFKIEG
ncbi:major capsid protein [Cytobacillus firmus]|uniref:major capsid protein n=1 Tax=Cytobacillus firmus TaxID=1399 RepID=UPI0018CD9821|nr:major capsid protein [Cytobacillus firmus]MBG9548342.1 coat protein [Cytobacillus firmus]MBG9600808.1 coat protein [Cytobacillus firmus]MBG9657826.1 coat protein [Cytobacillus firmus]MED1904829.1 major capsid protein [Cytobacillus firmus]MED1938935.1 major capsid protein [Cytobacillus firmus]